MTTQASGIDVAAWTADQAAEVFSTISLADPRPPRSTAVTVEIPLDTKDEEDDRPRTRAEAVHTVYKRREPVRRDSLKRREALLKGKEGSRRRQRWENDRLLSNPHAQPPLPSDWEVRPTYPVQRVPYFLAPLWDAEYAKKVDQRRMAKQGGKVQHESAAAQKVTQELRAKLKRARGAKGLLQDLEEEVREFVKQWEAKQRDLEAAELIDADSGEEEEIVFVGRNCVTHDELQSRRNHNVRSKDKLIFQSLVDDHGASFGYVSPDQRRGGSSSLLKLCQTISRPFNCHLLRPPHVVGHNWRPCAKGSICWCLRCLVTTTLATSASLDRGMIPSLTLSKMEGISYRRQTACQPIPEQLWPRQRYLRALVSDTEMSVQHSRIDSNANTQPYIDHVDGRRSSFSTHRCTNDVPSKSTLSSSPTCMAMQADRGGDSVAKEHHRHSQQTLKCGL